MPVTGGKKKSKTPSKTKSSKSKSKSSKSKSKSKSKRPAKSSGLKFFDDYDTTLSMLGVPFGITNPFMDLPVPYHNPFTFGRPEMKISITDDDDFGGIKRSKDAFIDRTKTAFVPGSRTPSTIFGMPGISATKTYSAPGSANPMPAVSVSSTHHAPTGGAKKKKKKTVKKSSKSKKTSKKPSGGIKRKPAKKTNNSIH